MLDLASLARPAGSLNGVTGAGAVDQDALLAVRSAGLRETSVDRSVAGHVDVAEQAVDVGRDGGTFVGIHVEKGDLDAGRCERPCSRFAPAPTRRR